MAEAIAILALLFVALVVLGVYASVKAIGAAKRGVDRTLTQARRTVEDTTLRAKSMGQGGVAGELAQLRLSLRTSMRATQDALAAGAAEDASLQESLQLFRRLSAHGHELDEDLKRMERDPDRTRVAAHLQDLRERTRRITDSADALRWAARERAQKFADDELDTLSAQIDMEAGALRHWTTSETPGTTDRRPPEASGTRSPGTSDTQAARPAPPWTARPETQDRTGTSWPEAGAGQTPTQTWPADADGDRDAAADPTARGAAAGGDRDTGGAAEGARPAITARDPRLETGYPWQKARRPETTN
ncbi:MULTISPECIES: hypothetical protein [Streptomyces]|uniref:Secreted protein n=2 Tax=Streptomyces TaxID=1883 RepID=A0A100Y4P9_9ACTN|nr:MULTISPECIES: hypothetical protein [Streptomyces]KUH37616.1 hypothetical protein ATE80_17110 [Streptomyces kanasensis]UUS30998.1 hypothetical protein NRO40_09210 [Streptomyces changanensis]